MHLNAIRSNLTSIGHRLFLSES